MIFYENKLLNIFYLILMNHSKKMFGNKNNKNQIQYMITK